MNRIVAPAALAVVILLGSAVSIWVVLVRGVASSMTVQARLADESLDAHVPFTPALASTLVRTGTHVALFDAATATVIEATVAGVVQRPAGGIVGLPPPPPGAPPPPLGGPPPGSPPAARERSGPLDAFAQTFVRIAPLHVAREDRAIDIAPDLPVLARWFALDVGVFVLAGLAVIGFAVARVVARARHDRRALEARITERAEAAERYQRFLAETGHELRTPLTVLAGYVDILRANNGSGAVDPRVLEGMHAETSRMRRLVEKMMTLARLDSQAVVPRLLDAGTAAREAAMTLQRRYADRDVRVFAENSASIIIDADDYAAALGNLLENAVTYAPQSPIVLETRVRDGHVTTAVIDRGPGIGDEEREAIFGRFYRGNGRALGEGLGLGLAIVRRVAERWNGTIECSSGSGRTEFRLTFPVADEVRDGVA